MATSRTWELNGRLSRVGGVLGLAWLVLFIIGVFVLQGDSPERDDSIAEIRRYFIEDGDTYLLGDYLIGIAFMVFFLPFLIILNRVLSSNDNSLPTIASRVGLFAGALAILWGGLAGISWGALAIGAAENPQVDASSVRTLMEIDAYAFAGLLFPVGLFMGAAGLSIWLSGLLWRWVGAIGIIGFVCCYIGAAWPIDGDDEGAVAGFGFVGLTVIAVFVLLVSINLLMMKSRGAVAEPAAQYRADL